MGQKPKNMYCWTFIFDGSIYEPTVVIAAGVYATAKSRARAEVIRLGYNPDSLELTDKRKIISGSVLYSRDGDY